MSSLPKPRYTPEQYLEMERKAEFKSEYVNGEILAMAGASLEHNRINRNIGQSLANQLENKPCESFTNNLRVKVNPTRYAYPDAVVACGEMDFEDSGLDTLLNPVVIIEVLSPTTEVDDRGWKFAHWRRAGTMMDYVLIAQDRPSIEHYTRFGQDLWTLREAEGLAAILRLPSIGCELPLSQIYARVEFPANSILPDTVDT
jgi:Uma2 family endonuclease